MTWVWSSEKSSGRKERTLKVALWPSSSCPFCLCLICLCLCLHLSNRRREFQNTKLFCIKWVAEINIWQSPKDYNKRHLEKKITWNWCFKSMLQRNDNYPRVRKYDARTVEITTGENKPSAPITEMEIANFKEMRACSWYSQFVCELYLSSIKKSPSLVLLYVAIF